MEEFWIWFTTLMAGSCLFVTVMMTLCGCLLPLVVLGAAGGVGIWLYRRIAQPVQAFKRAAQSWSATPGVILSSSVIAETGYDSRDLHLTRYRPGIQYEYEVNGQHYQSFMRSAGDHFYTEGMGRDGAQMIVGRYPAGAHVMVYYDPADPQVSLLER